MCTRQQLQYHTVLYIPVLIAVIRICMIVCGVQPSPNSASPRHRTVGWDDLLRVQPHNYQVVVHSLCELPTHTKQKSPYSHQTTVLATAADLVVVPSPFVWLSVYIDIYPYLILSIQCDHNDDEEYLFDDCCPFCCCGLLFWLCLCYEGNKNLLFVVSKDAIAHGTLWWCKGCLLSASTGTLCLGCGTRNSYWSMVWMECCRRKGTRTTRYVLHIGITVYSYINYITWCNPHNNLNPNL